jgi:hypothetical protein
MKTELFEVGGNIDPGHEGLFGCLQSGGGKVENLFCRRLLHDFVDQAGSKGMHMNFVFVAEVSADAEVRPNHEFSEFRWVDRGQLADLKSPLNVREFGYLALDAVAAAGEAS